MRPSGRTILRDGEFFRGVWAPKRACRGEAPSHLLVTAHSSVKVGGTFWSSPGKSRFDTGVGGSQFWRLIWAESVRGVYGQREVGPIFGRMKSFERAPRFAVGTASCTEAIPNIGPTSPGGLLAATPQVAEIQSVLQPLMGRASVGICWRRLPRLCRSNHFRFLTKGRNRAAGCVSVESSIRFSTWLPTFCSSDKVLLDRQRPVPSSFTTRSLDLSARSELANIAGSMVLENQ